MFNIDFVKLIHLLLPSFLRTTKMQAWLRSLATPIESLYNSFLTHRDNTIFDVNVTGQVCSLEYMLNKLFYSNGELNLIHISDSLRNPRVYIYQASENTPLFLYNNSESHDPVYLFNNDDPPGSDFTVWVPDNLIFDLAYMRGLLDKHKAAGFKYNIKYYTLQQNPT